MITMAIINVKSGNIRWKHTELYNGTSNCQEKILVPFSMYTTFKHECLQYRGGDRKKRHPNESQHPPPATRSFSSATHTHCISKILRRFFRKLRVNDNISQVEVIFV